MVSQHTWPCFVELPCVTAKDLLVKKLPAFLPTVRRSYVSEHRQNLGVSSRYVTIITFKTLCVTEGAHHVDDLCQRRTLVHLHR